MSVKTKISILGIGLMGSQHLKAIEHTEEAEIHSIVDLNEDTKSLALENKIPWYNHLDQMLDHNNLPDGVIIATPNQLHEEHTLKIFHKKIPVLLEKPIADSIESAKKIIKTAKQENVNLLIGYHRRHNPISKVAKQEIDKGTLGKLISVHGICWLYKPDDYFSEKWRTRKGAGPLGINLVHDIDLLCYLLGPIKTIQAITSNKTRNFEVEDTAVIILEFKSGVLGTLNVSDTIVSPWSYELTAGENPAYPKTSESSYFIGGSKGSIELPNARFWFNKTERSWWNPIYSEQIPIKKDHPLINQIQHFCRVISKEEKPIVSGEDGLISLMIFEAITRSANEGIKVFV